jgi:hypothetical protein
MRKMVGVDEKVPLLLTGEQISLIIEHTFAEDSLLNALRISEVVGTKRKAMFTLHDLESLDGDVAAIANHSEDKKLQKKLDSIFQAIQKVEDKYDLRY